MNAQNHKKLVSLSLGLLLLPLFAACQPNQTAQTPTTAPPTTEQPTTETPATPAPPPTTGGAVDDDVVDVIDNNPSLSTLSTLIDEADLGDQLDDGGPHTIFAPSDQAFTALPEATRQRLLQPENRETLRQILTYHVVPGNLTAGQLQSGEVQTLGGNTVNYVNGCTYCRSRIDRLIVSRPTSAVWH
jgi:uncharacterized surface protein with fasciclin (FAS1) repeats